MEKVGKGAVMQADRDGHAGRGRPGETGGGGRWRRRIKGRWTETKNSKKGNR